MASRLFSSCHDWGLWLSSYSAGPSEAALEGEVGFSSFSSFLSFTVSLVFISSLASCVPPNNPRETFQTYRHQGWYWCYSVFSFSKRETETQREGALQDSLSRRLMVGLQSRPPLPVPTRMCYSPSLLSILCSCRILG